MTKNDWSKVATATLISVFLGAIVLFVVLRKNRKSKLQLKDLYKLTQEDIEYWKGVTETSEKGATKLSEWWGNMGYNYSVDSLKSSSFQSAHYWSAIYISNLMKRWGAGDRFKYSARHSDYICDGIKAEEAKDKSRLFWSVDPKDDKVEVGDMIGLSRGSGITLKNVCAGAPTHVDAVFQIVKTDNGYKALVIGGNVSNTVKVSSVELDKDRRIKYPDKYLVLMKNQAL